MSLRCGKYEPDFLSLINKHNQIVGQMPLPNGWTEDQVIELDAFLREHKILSEDEELAITQEMEDASAF